MSPIFRHGRNKRALVRRGCSALYHHIRRDVRRSKEVIESAMMKSKREVGLTVLGFVLLVLPVLARGTPLHFVLDDRHSSQGLRLPELHHRGAGERFHQLDVGRRRHVCNKKKKSKKKNQYLILKAGMTGKNKPSQRCTLRRKHMNGMQGCLEWRQKENKCFSACSVSTSNPTCFPPRTSLCCSGRKLHLKADTIDISAARTQISAVDPESLLICWTHSPLEEWSDRRNSAARLPPPTGAGRPGSSASGRT